MDTPRIVLLSTVPVLGLVVLLSYYICFVILSTPASYLAHPLWYQMDPAHVRVCVVFQALAAIGFLLVFFYLVSAPPAGRSGLFGYMNGYTPQILLMIFLVASIAWPFCTIYHQTAGAVVSLLLVAAASIGLLAGCTESYAPVWALLGAMSVCIVTVLQDAVMWNAMYLLNRK